jgi:hypothetical protein
VVSQLQFQLESGLDDLPVGVDTLPRLAAAEGSELVMCWLRAVNETVEESLRMPCSLYDEMAADSKEWPALRQELSSGLFVDMNRLPVTTPTRG